jgi:uncharacterized membrane protein required for colicin V production
MEITAPAALIDLFFLILCLKIIHTAVSKGILQESFRLVGVFVGALFAFHFYSLLGNGIVSKVSFLNKQFVYLISFLVIFITIRVIFRLLRLIITLLFKLGELSIGERWMAFLLGAIRAAFLSSVIIFLFYLSPLNSKYYTKNISYKVFKNIAPKTYLISFDVYKKFNPKSECNKEVEEYYEVKKSLPGNSEEGN